MSDDKKQALEIHRIYVKDLSLESPHTPQIFQKEWGPEVSIDIDTSHTQLENNTYDVVLHITATATVKKEVIFLAEVKQAGIFSLNGFVGEELNKVLGIYCVNVLYPYAREVISDMVIRASFPQLNLTPINFEAFYEQRKQSEETKH